MIWVGDSSELLRTSSVNNPHLLLRKMPRTISASPADSVRVFEISDFVELWPYLREAGWSCQRDPRASVHGGRRENFIYVRPNGIATRGGRVGFDYFDEKGDVVAFVKTNRLTTSRPEMGTVHRLELSWSSVQIGGPVSPSAMGSTATVFKGNISNVFGSGEHITPQPTLGTQTIAK